MNVLDVSKPLVPGLILMVSLMGCQSTASTSELKSALEAQTETAQESSQEQVLLKEDPLPKSIELDVPFSSQAPFEDWGDPYQEGCEEMSVILVDYYLRDLPLSPEQANRELLQLVQWQEASGYAEDVSIQELGVIVEEYYGYNARIIEDVTIDALKRELAKGNPVVVPAAGRELNNPYYSGEGPEYHMLVVTGYTKRTFVTNDVGTKRGEKYDYRHRTLFDAIHDWTGSKETIRKGAKRVLVMEKR